MTAVAAAAAYLDAVHLLASVTGDSVLTAVLAVGAALGWPGD